MPRKYSFNTFFMECDQFCYSTGCLIDKGDRIVVIDQQGVVEEVVIPQTPQAKDYSCFNTGGVLLRFDSGDLQLWPYINEDLVLIRKGGASSGRPE